MNRPNFESIKSGAEFNQWYWLKTEMVDICKKSGLPAHGRKFDLRDRIMHALDHDGQIKPAEKKPDPISKFNWARAELTLETRITDNLSFGPNFRKFMTREIGPKFTCHSDFMDWVRSNVGKTLQEAISAWQQLESRKDNPDFKRNIAENNMYSQYIRDFMEDNPDQTLKEVRKYWLLKRQLPTSTGFIRYEPSDLQLA